VRNHSGDTSARRVRPWMQLKHIRTEDVLHHSLSFGRAALVVVDPLGELMFVECVDDGVLCVQWRSRC
jgi:hypothetical protein